MPGRHLRRSLALFAFLCSFTSAATGAAPAPTLPNCSAAGCVPANWGAGQIAAGYGVGAPEFHPGQTFKPKLTGVLSSLRLGLESAAPEAAVVEIRTTTPSGLPTNTVLGTATVAGAPYTAGVLYSANFAPQNIVLNAGTRYAIVFTGTPTHIYVLAAFPACNAVASGAEDYIHTYDYGVTWSKLPTRDRSIIFQVCLDAATATRATTWGRVKSIYR